jgi:outer membrane biosynthesis protein TonB
LLEPLPESDAPVALVTQEAAAEVLLVNPDAILDWVLEQIEKEKYYPPTAERLGITGIFDLTVTVDQGGTIIFTEVHDGKGHRVLRQALEKMLIKLIGRNFGRSISEAVEFEVEFEFE